MRIWAVSHRLQTDTLLLLPTMLGVISVLDPRKHQGSHCLQQKLQHRHKAAELPFCKPWVFLLSLHVKWSSETALGS